MGVEIESAVFHPNIQIHHHCQIRQVDIGVLIAGGVVSYKSIILERNAVVFHGVVLEHACIIEGVFLIGLTAGPGEGIAFAAHAHIGLAALYGHAVIGDAQFKLLVGTGKGSSKIAHGDVAVIEIIIMYGLDVMAAAAIDYQRKVFQYIMVVACGLSYHG